MDRTVWVVPTEIVRQEYNSLRGRLLSAIESVGLPRGQEEAIKKLAKSITFQSQWLIEEIVETLEGEDREVKFRYAPNNLEYIENGADQVRNG